MVSQFSLKGLKDILSTGEKAFFAFGKTKEIKDKIVKEVVTSSNR